ncbi:hypothetical protein KSS87_008246 [Heliosperma pusillum]|nr:hypothetical protein KSS87_008246 [Heliosperma pusillum]
MGDEVRKTHCSYNELQCKEWVMKQGSLIVHTRSYNETMDNAARKTHCSQKELQCNNGKEDLLFTQGVTMQTTGNEARNTHCSHKELHCKQLVMKQGRLIVYTRSYNVTMGNEETKTHCSHKELQGKQWVMK